MKNKAWSYATAVVVILIILNPEMIEVAMFIDAVGLELFLMLFEVQMLAILSVLLNNIIKPPISNLKKLLKSSLLTHSRKKMREGVEGLIVSVPSEAVLMHLLVFSSVTSGVLGMHM